MELKLINITFSILRFIIQSLITYSNSYHILIISRGHLELLLRDSKVILKSENLILIFEKILKNYFLKSHHILQHILKSREGV